MKTIAIISQKGETTLALNLAGTAEIFGHRSVVVSLLIIIRYLHG
jgi:hypothetical protein